MLHFYTGTFLISFATFLFQISLMRIFAISQWYHFAFMAVSLSLLGFGASGSFLSIYPKFLKKGPQSYTVRYSFFFAISAVLSFLAINFLPFDSYKIVLEPVQIFYFFLYYIVLSVPFFFSGLITGLLLSKFPHKANNIYFASMSGSGLGAISYLFIASFLPVQKIVIVASFIGVFAGVFFKFRKKEVAFGLLTLYLIFLVQYLCPVCFDINTSPYKNLSLALKPSGSRIFKTVYSAQSKVDVIDSHIVKFAPGLSYIYPKPLPKQLGVCIDGQDMNAITYVNRITKKTDFVDYMPQSVVFGLKKDSDILIINPRGGLEVLNALYHDTYPITVCEDNPAIIDILKGDLNIFSGEIYKSKLVKIFASGPRSFLNSYGDKFGIIDIPLTENFNVVVAGVYSLNENHIYTTEAIEEYISKLRPDGMLVMTRWLQMPPSEELRLGVNILEALETLRFKNPSENIVAIRSWMTATYLVKNGPFLPDEIKKIKEFCAEKKFDIIYAPGITKDEVNLYNILPRPFYYEAFGELLDRSKRKEFIESYQFDISPTYDWKPFFFHFFKWSQFPSIIKNIGKHWLPFAGSGYLVIFLILIIAVLSSVLLIILPIKFWYKEPLARASKERFLIYFFLLGFGYIFIEICLMQQFIVYLDQPIYSFSVILGSVLFSSGLGSLFSKIITSKKIFIFLLVLLPLEILTYIWCLPMFFNIFPAASIMARIFISFSLIFPISFLMGVPFPLGIKLAAKFNKSLLPWLWGINGFASVISAILAIILATSFGYPVVFAIAGIVYFVSFLFILPIFSRVERIELR